MRSIRISFVVSAGLLFALPLSAQTIIGRVLDAETNQSISAAEVSLIDSAGVAVARVLSGEAGDFRLTAPAPGVYSLRGRRIGFAETSTARLQLDSGRAIEVELRLSVDAVTLEPLTVTGDRAVVDLRLERRGYYERKELYGERVGFGQFLEEEDLERLRAFRVTDYFRQINGFRTVSPDGRRVQIRSTRYRNCSPVIYIDGFKVTLMPGETLDELVSASNIVAMEVYPGSVSPLEVLGGRCGSVALWTGVRERD